MKDNLRKVFFSCIVIASCAACQPVRPYQRMYVDDHEMLPGHSPVQQLEENAQVYREGAVGGGGRKGSGGCGCN